MIEYWTDAGYWCKLNPDYIIGKHSFNGDNIYNQSNFRINNKIYTEYSEELILAFNKARMWEKLSGIL